MKPSGLLRNTLFALALYQFSAPPAEAIEIFGGANLASQLNDDWMQVRARGGGVRHGGGHRGGGMHHGGMHRPGGAHRPAARPGNVNRNVNRNVHRNVSRNVHRNVNRNVSRNVNRNVYRGRVWAGRPGWYRWAPGGAIAAGAALGFVAAATAAAWAGPAPQGGLCWYYTDPSRRQGFWDFCP